MKKSTLLEVGGASVVGIALGAVSTVVFNKIKSSKEEKIELDESETSKDESDEDSAENQEG